jgi:hypothetical protein
VTITRPATDIPAAATLARSERSRARAVVLVLLRTLLLAPAVVFAAMIACHSAPDAHPDENMHVDAFRFFETHRTRPALNSDDLLYSPMGQSRVYTGEIVYPLYGRLGHLAHLRYPDLDPYLLYRSLNVFLLAVTLATLALARCRWFNPWLLAVFLVCIPQVPYLYAYANSDAFGLSASVLLFLHTARLIDTPPLRWRLRSLALFWLLFLCTLLSKTSFQMGILLPTALLVLRLVRTRPAAVSPAFVITRLLLPLVAVYVLAAAWNPTLSPTRADWNRRYTAMKDDRAIDGRKPSDPWQWNYYLASKGATYHAMLRHRDLDTDYLWLVRTAQSFYCRFGGWRILPPDWLFTTASILALASIALTLTALILFHARMNWETTLCLLCAPILFALSLFGSMYQSLHIDFQPQGRYLFGSLVPLFFLAFGTLPAERGGYRWVHSTLPPVLLALSYYATWTFGAAHESLRDGPWFG